MEANQIDERICGLNTYYLSFVILSLEKSIALLQEIYRPFELGLLPVIVKFGCFDALTIEVLQSRCKHGLEQEVASNKEQLT